MIKITVSLEPVNRKENDFILKLLNYRHFFFYALPFFRLSERRLRYYFKNRVQFEHYFVLSIQMQHSRTIHIGRMIFHILSGRHCSFITTTQNKQKGNSVVFT